MQHDSIAENYYRSFLLYYCAALNNQLVFLYLYCQVFRCFTVPLISICLLCIVNCIIYINYCLSYGYWGVFTSVSRFSTWPHSMTTVLITILLNKNWVTVRDKCPHINVQFKWHTFSKIIRTDGRMDTRTDIRTDGRTDRLYYAPNFIWGPKNNHNRTVTTTNRFNTFCDI